MTRTKATFYKGEYKQRVTISLTQSGLAQLDELAKAYRLSRSELIERVGRGLIPLALPTNPEANPLAS